MSKNPDMDVFARVDGLDIVEYPVIRLYIQNRAHPMVWYRPVVELEKPALPDFHYYRTVLTLKGAYVEAAFVPMPYTLEQMLSSLIRLDNEVPAVPLVGEVDSKVIGRINELAGNYITKKFSDFARERQYGTETVDPIVSLSTYLTSNNAQMRAEAEYVFRKRDEAWANLLSYMAKVMSGEVPVPTTIEEIDAQIPVLDWSEVN